MTLKGSLISRDPEKNRKDHMAELLRVNGLETQFKTREGIVHAVNGVSFSLGNMKRSPALQQMEELFRFTVTETKFTFLNKNVFFEPGCRGCQRIQNGPIASAAD